MDYIDPAIGLPIAAGLWIVYILMVLKDRKKDNAPIEDNWKEVIK